MIDLLISSLSSSGLFLKSIQLQAFGRWSFKNYMVMKNDTIQKEIRLSFLKRTEVKQKLVKRTIDKLPVTFPYLFKAFLECKKPPARNNWFEKLEKWSYKASVTPNFDSNKILQNQSKFNRKFATLH